MRKKVQKTLCEAKGSEEEEVAAYLNKKIKFINYGKKVASSECRLLMIMVAVIVISAAMSIVATTNLRVQLTSIQALETSKADISNYFGISTGLGLELIKKYYKQSMNITDANIIF